MPPAVTNTDTASQSGIIEVPKSFAFNHRKHWVPRITGVLEPLSTEKEATTPVCSYHLAVGTPFAQSDRYDFIVHGVPRVLPGRMSAHSRGAVHNPFQKPSCGPLRSLKAPTQPLKGLPLSDHFRGDCDLVSPHIR